MLCARSGGHTASVPLRVGQEPDCEVGAGAAEVQSVERTLVQMRAPVPKRGDVLAPGCDRIRLLEPDRVGDRLPQPLDVRLAEHLLGPALIRVGRDRPGDRAGVLRLVQSLEKVARTCPPDALSVEIGEQVRIRVARDHHERAVVSDRPRLLEKPGGSVRQHLVLRVLDHRAAHVLVDVADVDVTGAGLVARAGERACELGMLDLTVDEQRLPGLEVHSDPHDQLRVALQAIHGRNHRGPIHPPETVV